MAGDGDKTRKPLWVFGARCSGKTHEMIKRSAETGAVILCQDHATAMSIKSRAKNVGMNIPEPLPFAWLPSMKVVGSRDQKYLIDNAEVFMMWMLDYFTGNYSMDILDGFSCSTYDGAVDSKILNLFNIDREKYSSVRDGGEIR